MKNLFITILLATALLISSPVSAQRPDIVIDGDVVVEYAINVDVDGTEGTTFGQFVDESNIVGASVVIDNDLSTSTKLKVDATAVGNTASISGVNPDLVVQSVQDSTILATAMVLKNKIGASTNVKVTSTAVGNNLDLIVDGSDLNGSDNGDGDTSDDGGDNGRPGKTNPNDDKDDNDPDGNAGSGNDDKDDNGNNGNNGGDNGNNGGDNGGDQSGDVSIVQLVEGTNVLAVSVLANNTFGKGRPFDPTVESASVGNLVNIEVNESVPLSVSQFTIKGSNVGALSAMVGNRGRIGPVNVSSQAIGNSISVSAGIR